MNDHGIKQIHARTMETFHLFNACDPVIIWGGGRAGG
jgi:hypothetical protein